MINVILSSNHIPSIPTPCPYHDCVYNGESEEGVCDDPQIGYLNGDSRCHRRGVKWLLGKLGVDLGETKERLPRETGP